MKLFGLARGISSLRHCFGWNSVTKIWCSKKRCLQCTSAVSHLPASVLTWAPERQARGLVGQMNKWILLVLLSQYMILQATLLYLWWVKHVILLQHAHSLCLVQAAAFPLFFSFPICLLLFISVYSRCKMKLAGARLAYPTVWSFLKCHFVPSTHLLIHLLPPFI